MSAPTPEQITAVARALHRATFPAGSLRPDEDVWAVTRQIHQAALERARAERPDRRTDPAPLARLAGQTLREIRSTDR